MKLCFAPTSPYVRKCLVVAHETGVIGRIEIVPVNPWQADSPIAAVNPLGKVPALVTDDGAALFDSRVICEYLDSLHDGRQMFPPAAAARWRALRQAALGEGILDAADSRIMESRRPPGTRDAAWDERKRTAIERTLDALEQEAAAFAEVTIGLITIGCALGEMDFRFAGEDWRASRGRLARWFEAFAQRPSMAATLTRHWDGDAPAG